MGETAQLQVGRVGRPHGLDGSFHVTRPRSRVLRAAPSVTIAGHLRRVERHAGTDARPLLLVAGCDAREQVDALRGQDILVDRGVAPALESDEWYAEDLEGCAVVDGDDAVGVVTRLLAYPSCELLEVARSGAAPLLVPLIGDAVRGVDVDLRRIDVDLGFLGEGN